MTQTNRYLERGTWEHVIADGMNRFNPCCVYMFKNHKVSVAKKRSKMKMTPIFRGVNYSRNLRSSVLTGSNVMSR
jgi:hypothetical protein